MEGSVLTGLMLVNFTTIIKKICEEIAKLSNTGNINIASDMCVRCKLNAKIRFFTNSKERSAKISAS